jgi:alpha-mannosidase
VSARDRVLRNESIELEIDKETGGIRGLHAPGEPTARLGQQLAVVGGLASKMRATSLEVEYGGPALVQAVARGTLVDARDQRPLAAFRQRYRLWTGRPILELEVELQDLDARLLEACAGAGVDPWSHFIACRWAWPDPSSMLRRTCLLAPELTEAERPESPDAIDISTRRQRTALLFGGLAHHARHGTRMLDTLLIAGRETARVFTLGVVLDREHPFHAALDLVTPAVVVPTDTGPPRSGPSGWFLQRDNPAVAIAHVGYLDSSGDGRGWGLAVHLIETAGRPARCRLRLFRDPLWARQTDFNHELIVDLPIDGDAVQVDLTPHEIARVDVTLG